MLLLFAQEAGEEEDGRQEKEYDDDRDGSPAVDSNGFGGEDKAVTDPDERAIAKPDDDPGWRDSEDLEYEAAAG